MAPHCFDRGYLRNRLYRCYPAPFVLYIWVASLTLRITVVSFALAFRATSMLLFLFTSYAFGAISEFTTYDSDDLVSTRRVSSCPLLVSQSTGRSIASRNDHRFLRRECFPKLCTRYRLSMGFDLTLRSYWTRRSWALSACLPTPVVRSSWAEQEFGHGGDTIGLVFLCLYSRA